MGSFDTVIAELAMYCSQRRVYRNRETVVTSGGSPSLARSDVGGDQKGAPGSTGSKQTAAPPRPHASPPPPVAAAAMLLAARLLLRPLKPQGPVAPPLAASAAAGRGAAAQPLAPHPLDGPKPPADAAKGGERGRYALNGPRISARGACGGGRGKEGGGGNVDAGRAVSRAVGIIPPWRPTLGPHADADGANRLSAPRIIEEAERKIGRQMVLHM